MTGTGRPGRWLALHVFYAANPQPLLAECVAPLVADLREAGLLDGYFFINYWLEGPHVRLRLRPVDDEAEAEVRRRAEAAIGAFLARRPALYAMGFGYLGELYDILFALEYPQGKPAELMNADGTMRLAPNNSYSYRAYEPEYGKYGGVEGVALAEWHFEHSSDLVLEAIRSMNLHLRSVQLGTAAQLMVAMAGTFLPDRAALADFMDDYHRFWHQAFTGTNFIGTDEYAKMYDQTAPGLRTRMAAILDAVDAGDLGRLPGFLGGWAAHAVELRDRVRSLAEAGTLAVSSWDGTQRVTVTDPVPVLTTLLSPYLHMTNNRFHVTIRDEAYLSYLIGRVLREALTPAAAG